MADRKSLEELVQDLRQDAGNCAAMGHGGVYVDISDIYDLMDAALSAKYKHRHISNADIEKAAEAAWAKMNPSCPPRLWRELSSIRDPSTKFSHALIHALGFTIGDSNV